MSETTQSAECETLIQIVSWPFAVVARTAEARPGHSDLLECLSPRPSGPSLVSTSLIGLRCGRPVRRQGIPVADDRAGGRCYPVFVQAVASSRNCPRARSTRKGGRAHSRSASPRRPAILAWLAANAKALDLFHRPPTSPTRVPPWRMSRGNPSIAICLSRRSVRCPNLLSKTPPTANGARQAGPGATTARTPGLRTGLGRHEARCGECSRETLRPAPRLPRLQPGRLTQGQLVTLFAGLLTTCLPSANSPPAIPT